MFLQDLQNTYDHWRESLNGQRPVLAAKINSLRNHVESPYTEYLCALADIECESFRSKCIGILTGVDRVEVKNIHY